jgi:hypothetical protein
LRGNFLRQIGTIFRMPAVAVGHLEHDLAMAFEQLVELPVAVCRVHRDSLLPHEKVPIMKVARLHVGYMIRATTKIITGGFQGMTKYALK